MERKEIGQNMVYTYAYNHILNPGEKTTTLFDTVTFANIIEGQLDMQQLDMPVRAYAIQATNTGDGSNDFRSRTYRNMYIRTKDRLVVSLNEKAEKSGAVSFYSRNYLCSRDSGIFFGFR